MANTSDEKWYFTKERLENTPSRQCGIEAYKELSYRQQAANFIQDMGQRLKVSQLCINTAIVYMHRFYVFHSFTHFPWASIASASIFLAAKVEEQPRKLEHVIRCANLCKNLHDTKFEITSDRYQAQSQDLVFNENVLLQTLGFDVAIDHPHTHVVRCCHLVRASKDLAQTSYFIASNSLHLTTMCLQYKPTVVACFCIHLVCKWSNWEIPLSNEKREWFSYVDPTVTAELLKQLTEEFLAIFEKCPSRLKEKIMEIGGYSPFEGDKKMNLFPEPKEPHHRAHHESKPGPAEDPHKHRSSRPHEGSSSNAQVDREYRDKREAERMARHSSKPSLPNASGKQPVLHGHHRPPVDPKLKQHSRPPSSGHPPTSRPDPHRDILREAARDIGLKDHREPNRESRDSSDLSRELNSMNKDMTSSNSSISRDLQQVRSNDKDVQKRDYLLKPAVNSDTNSYSVDKRNDPSKSRVSVHPSGKVALKHESMRRHDESKPYVSKTDSELKKQHMSSSSFLNKSVNSTSRKMEPSPFTPDTSKSVLKQNPSTLVKDPPNGSSNSGSFGLCLSDDKIKDVKDDGPVLPVKKPSLFSPEKSPPKRPKTPPSSSKRSMEISTVPSTSQIPPTMSPFSSPDGANDKRNRTISSSSEPELRPVMKKIDQIEGFENLLRDSSIGIKVHHKVPDIITPIADIKEEKLINQVKELKPPELILPFTGGSSGILPQPMVNGIETNPTLISNLLKETPNMSHLNAITSPAGKDGVKEHKDKEHHHKERKKKNKEKHKHKDRNRDDKEKKKKHKDKDREKHKNKSDVAPVTQPIKITISKDKIQPLESPVVSTGLKIKIPKERLKVETVGESSSQMPLTGGLKIKIPKDFINNFSGESKKRDRERSSPTEAPPSKVTKSSYARTSDSKQNGRSSYPKVTQQGDGETSVHRLAESKYINKGAST